MPLHPFGPAKEAQRRPEEELQVQQLCFLGVVEDVVVDVLVDVLLLLLLLLLVVVVVVVVVVVAVVVVVVGLVSRDVRDR